MSDRLTYIDKLKGAGIPADQARAHADALDAAKSNRRARSEASFDAFLSMAVTPWPFDAEDALHAGNIRAELECAGTPIGHYDYLISAQARRRGVALVTLNRREFDRVPGLVVVDWTT